MRSPATCSTSSNPSSSTSLEAADRRRQRAVPERVCDVRAVWRKDSRALTFEYNQRGHQVYRVIEVERRHRTGRARSSQRSRRPSSTTARRTARSPIPASSSASTSTMAKKSIWMSERDGWNHLYLFDGATGAVKNQITKGEWVVRARAARRPVARQIWFSAGGMYPGKDPVLRALLPDQFRRLRADAAH